MIPPGDAPASDARRYAVIRYRLLLVDLACSAALLGWWQWSGWSHGLASWWRARAAWEPAAIAGYLLVFGGVSYAILWPLHFYGGFLLEHRFNLSRLTFRAWCRREAKQLAVSGLLGLVLVEGFYAILRQAPGTWPLWATLGWVMFSVVLARLFPTLILPLFYKTTPLQDADLSQRLLALCQRAGLSVIGVFRFDLGAETRKANAALAGLGGTRRVLLTDTLLGAFTPEEVEGVLAHELGHHRFHHVRAFLVLSAVGSWAAFTLTDILSRRWLALWQLDGLTDLAGFPCLALWFWGLGLVGLPLQNGISRLLEWQADRFAVRLTTGRAFAAALRRLAALNLADPSPPRWMVWFFYDHPPITQRIAAAEAS